MHPLLPPTARPAPGWPPVQTLVAGVALLTLAACCGVPPYEHELQRIAKDWCLTIRASQVIPVYPLTEDLRPGDVFVVQLPIQAQHKEYADKGFLRLDQHLTRLPHLDSQQASRFASFYRKAYGIPDKADTPIHWREASAPNTHGWAAAPRAAFPSYTVEVASKGAFGAAFPIQSIPLAVNALDARSARASVSLEKALTYGLDEASLYVAAQAWIEKNPDLVARYTPGPDGSPVYLRVITRVYLVAAIDVSIQADRVSAVGVAAGSLPELEGELQAETRPAERVALADRLVRTRAQGLLNALPQQVGARLSLTSATSRSIGMKETFEQPLVIGYLGFDVPLGPAGDLGRAVSTGDILLGRAAPPEPFGADPATARIEAWLDTGSAEEKARRNTELRALLERDPAKPMVTDFLNQRRFAPLRTRAIQHFRIP